MISGFFSKYAHIICSISALLLGSIFCPASAQPAIEENNSAVVRIVVVLSLLNMDAPKKFILHMLQV